jgi:hypothetical protein
MVTVGEANSMPAASKTHFIRCSASRLITNCSPGLAVNLPRTSRP